ncbi:MAG: Crp/Fnr family transcriptional regulator [Allosphingosinicella sp.]|uniref:Crp/Fnr family transcriptional regulator n=1 Tax=Allosphingosinicella sp. TaxID=2823234 RepID=UPI00392DC217
MRSIKTAQPSVPARTDIIHAGTASQSVYTLYSGWAYRYVMLRKGARQILDVLLPGDLIGLQSPLTGKVRHSVRSVTEVELCDLNGSRFKSVFDALPDLAEALVATLLYEEHRADIRLMLLGRQRPTERLAYFLLELRERLMRRGMTDGREFLLPLTYAQLADLIGVSRSQIGASLGDIRDQGWARLRAGRLLFEDVERMADRVCYQALPDPRIRALI